MEILSITKKNNLLSIFTKKNKHPQIRYVYAVTAGAFLGELLVYMETITDNHCFLSLPTMTVRQVPVDKFALGIKENIVDVVEKIPAKVYNVCKLQYNKNKSKVSC
jgi:hypothetical protein